MRKKEKRLAYQGFTLLEMLVVLFIIAILVLLFVPNLTAQQETIDTQGKEALTAVVRSQVTVYQINTGEVPTYDDLVQNNYLTNAQKEKALKWGISLEE